MSDEYSVHTRFLAGKLDEAGYLDKIAYMREQARVAEETVAYGAYLNARHAFDDADEQRCFDEDLLKARAAMEVAWLEQKAAIIKP